MFEQADYHATLYWHTPQALLIWRLSYRPSEHDITGCADTCRLSMRWRCQSRTRYKIHPVLSIQDTPCIINTGYTLYYQYNITLYYQYWIHPVLSIQDTLCIINTGYTLYYQYWIHPVLSIQYNSVLSIQDTLSIINTRYTLYYQCYLSGHTSSLLYNNHTATMYLCMLCNFYSW